jgi:cellulose synthase operon protein YhjU
MNRPLERIPLRREVHRSEPAARPTPPVASTAEEERPGAPVAPGEAPPAAQLQSTLPFRLGAWNFYFLAKLLLFWKGSIGFHPLENLGLAAFLLVPLRSPAARRVRDWIAVPIGVCLLYYDTWLPPITRTLSQASLLADFRPVYLVELMGRFVSWPAVAMLIIAWTVYRIVALRVRVGLFVVAALLAMALTEHQRGIRAPAGTGATANEGRAASGSSTAEADPDNALRSFYSTESHRSVPFNKPAAGDTPFDLIFLHVCSIAWDDLRMMGLEHHPLWKRFDITLTRFNSAASYSGPAAIRMLRAACGQPSHTALYSPAAQGCYLMGNLKEVGFEPELILNHDGHFDDFIGVVRKRGGLDVVPMALDGVAVAQHSFDDSPIYRDMGVLSRWLDMRRTNTAPRVAAYYNTMSLHDGNRLVGPDGKLNSRDTYKLRLTRLLDDLDQFMQKLEGDGRRAVVALVPEHGAAMRGDKMQIPGLREIPSPAITLVPVGIKVIGPQVNRTGAPAYIDQPTSYLAVSYILSRMLDNSPFSTAGFTPAEYLSDLPATEFVAENEDTVTMRQGDGYLLRLGKEGWSQYSTAAQQEGR